MMFFFHHYELPAVLQVHQPNPLAPGPPAPAPPPTLPQEEQFIISGFNFRRGQHEIEVNNSQTQTSPAANIPSLDLDTDDAHEPASRSVDLNRSHLETVDFEFLSDSHSNLGVATMVASNQQIVGDVDDLPPFSSDSEKQVLSEYKTTDSATCDSKALTAGGRVLDENLVAETAECNENNFDLCALDGSTSVADETNGAYSRDVSNQGVRLRKNLDNCEVEASETL